ncbi:hydrogen gas-evolving membrane-bound hydrogenase subunit E [Anaerotignum sp. MB30-C6]|uniref:hydrogen gas-evolving membrane-bound hydrogenase subunit E n=1 Tax=Anaerotignum sp. MB30-C6 TaxID=3070814 RepID=UPI0027DBFD85|nr:hydrogen gas-evolving membrane-bound hydrogenase subunit E [Anaerotignum sp. MB30-C6]WMI80210.1 MnhB domain-containing protein [Anaerotignum sp. MB30-C6]
MNEKKTFWKHLQAWVDGEEVILDADKYIVSRPKREKSDWRSHFTMEYVKEHRKLYMFLSIAISVLFIGIMLGVVNGLPEFGNPHNPANNEVMERYLESGIEETGATNFVAGMILDYRAFDTFAEANVLFLAVMCAVILLKKDSKNYCAQEEQEKYEDNIFDEREKKPILQMGGKVLAPLVILYGIYVILNGHLSPGGGFSGGSIIGAGLILYASAYGQKKMRTFFTFRTFTAISVGCLLTYCACKTYSFFTGANHVGFAIPKGTPGDILSGGFILPLNICVGLIVACTMYGFFALFTKGDI